MEPMRKQPKRGATTSIDMNRTNSEGNTSMSTEEYTQLVTGPYIALDEKCKNLENELTKVKLELTETKEKLVDTSYLLSVDFYN